MLKSTKNISSELDINSSVKKSNKTKKILKKDTSYTKFVPKIQKRDGSIVPFDFNKIVQAIYKAMLTMEAGSEEEAAMVGHKVMAGVVKIAKKYKNFLPTVEGIQDEVERELILSDYVTTAKHYILYRNNRAKLREHGIKVPEKVRQIVEESKKYFKGNPLGEFVYLRSYAKWVEGEGRRESWIETVDRYIGFMKENLENKLTTKEYNEVREAILNHEAMPSMRLMQFGGVAARRCNACAYNCAFIAPTKLQDFGEIMYLSASGCGVGFAVESKNIQALPQIKPQTGKTSPTYVIEDSKEGWCDALVLGLSNWFDGKDIKFDYSKIRPAGARLKTMGGKASGPDPLRLLLDFTREIILQKQGRRLTNLNAHDIICKIGEAIVSGGVRRSAMISLSDLDDVEMRDAKKGQFYHTDPHRSMSNNSAVYERKPTNIEFMDEWVALMKSGSGERGIFNRGGLRKTLPERRIKVLDDSYAKVRSKGPMGDPGTNPCGEIILQSKQFCNLTEVVARATDNEQSLLRKARVAAILGTYQSTLTRFNYLSKSWKDNCEMERLLGVSITGQWDCETVRNSKILKKMKNEIIKTNKKYAKRFGINASTCTTCTKPSGTVSQMVNCASGMHPRHSQYYIRRIRISATDSLFKLLRDQGVPYYPEVGQTKEDAHTFVLEFPVKSPKKSVFKDDMSALEQLEYWKMVKENYTEHNPSQTISIGENEWIEVAHWLYKNWDIIGGLSFLPRSDFVYRLAPYEIIDKDTYEKMLSRIENIDYSKLITYELQDETEMKRELACAGGTCELD